MKLNRIILLLFPAIPMFSAVVVLIGSGSTNCGGNSAALSQVRQIALVALSGASESPDHTFRFTAADVEHRHALSLFSRTHWLRKAHFLVSTTPVREGNGQPRRIMVVCDTPYRNVPQRRFWQAPPTHAAAFSDGTASLISTTEYAALDRSDFKPLDDFCPSASK